MATKAAPPPPEPEPEPAPAPVPEPEQPAAKRSELDDPAHPLHHLRNA